MARPKGRTPWSDLALDNYSRRLPAPFSKLARSRNKFTGSSVSAALPPSRPFSLIKPPEINSPMEAELFYPELAAEAVLHYLASVCSDRLISGMDFSLASFTGLSRRNPWHEFPRSRNRHALPLRPSSRRELSLL